MGPHQPPQGRCPFRSREVTSAEDHLSVANTSCPPVTANNQVALLLLWELLNGKNQTSPSSQLPASNTQPVPSVRSPDGARPPTLTDTVLTFFKLLTLHWSTSNPADSSGESPESLKECSASEETESTADAREIPVAHSLFKIQKMVSGTWLVTPHGDHQLAKPTNTVYGPTTLLSTAGSTLPSLNKS